MSLTIKSSGVYLIVFLFGWSCAVFSYSDLIYPKPKVVSEVPLIEWMWWDLFISCFFFGNQYPKYCWRVFSINEDKVCIFKSC